MPSKARVSSKTIPHYLIIILIFVIGILVYHNSILKGIFLFDDRHLIVDNPFIKNFSYLKEIFTTQLFHASGVYSNFYRPIQSLSFMLDYRLWKLDPFGYHLTNVLIHILTAISIYFLIYIISKRRDAGVVASLLFCVHTVLSWPVNYVASRADLLSAFFFVTTILLYILYKETDFSKYSLFLYISSIVAFILALLSKEITIILPFIILLYLGCFSKKTKQSQKEVSPNLLWIFFVIGGIYILLRSTLLDFSGGKLLEKTTGQIPLYLRMLTTTKAIMIYLRLLILPIGLHMEWNIAPAKSFLQDEVFLSIVALTIIAGFSYFLLRKDKLKFFCISWFFIALLPYSNIFPLAYFMGEAWLYVPSIGFFALAGIYLSDLRKRSKLWSWAVSVILSCVIVFYGFLTVKRSDVWADPVSLYNEILKYSPTSSKAMINMGVVLAERGLDKEAIEKYKDVVKVLPNDPDVHSNLGVVYTHSQQYEMALKEFEKALEFDPTDYVVQMNIGIIYKKKGEIKKAMAAYKKAVELNPNYALVYNNIGNIYLDKHQYDIAITYYKKAVNLDSNRSTFYENLGKAYKNKRMLKEAREAFERALELDPDNKSLQNELNR